MSVGNVFATDGIDKTRLYGGTIEEFSLYSTAWTASLDPLLCAGLGHLSSSAGRGLFRKGLVRFSHSKLRKLEEAVAVQNSLLERFSGKL